MLGLFSIMLIPLRLAMAPLSHMTTRKRDFTGLATLLGCKWLSGDGKLKCELSD